MEGVKIGSTTSFKLREFSALALVATIAWGTDAQSQTTRSWIGGDNGAGTSWGVTANWVGGIPPNAFDSNVIIDNRNGDVGSTISTMSISANRTLGLITFDNINSKLANTLNIDTNGSGGATDRILTLHTGITLANTSTTVAFRGSNAVLSMVLGANNVFTTSAGSLLQINSGVTISGGFGITTAGEGSVSLNAQNTFTGGVTVGAGTTLRLGGPNPGTNYSSTVTDGAVVSGFVGTGTLALQNGSTLVSTGSGERTLQNNLTLNGSLTFGAASNFTGALTFNSSSLTTPAMITLLGDTTITTHVSTTFGSIIGGAYSLTKQGAGTLTLTHPTTTTPNTYTGGTTVASGTLRIGFSGALGASSGLVRLGSVGGGDASLISYLAGYTYAQNIEVIAGSGGTLTLGNSSTFGSTSIFSGTLTLNDDLVLTSVAPAGFSVRLSGAISGSSAITKTGVGMVQLTNNNIGYSGLVTISAGILQVGNAGTIGGVGSGEVINNATFQINRSNSYTLGNLVSGTGQLIHNGAGTTTLSRTTGNTYSGGTTISAGRLLVANSTGSGTGTGPVTTSVDTVLGGTGTIAPMGSNGVVIAGQIAPGLVDAIGTLTFAPENGDAVFLGTSSLLFQLGGDGHNDRLVFAPTGTGLMDFSAMNPGTIKVSFFGGYTPALGHRFDLIDWSALGINGLSPALLDFSEAVLPDLAWEWDTSDFVSSGVISVALIPEPGRMMLCLVGGLMGLLRRRRLV
jgi:fibronectin-binding autotransporter adhesin